MLNWLPNSWLKSIKKPKIVMEEPIGQNYGGYYSHNSSILTIVGETEHTESTIVHEFIHYKQELAGILPTNYVYSIDNFKHEWEYEDNIKKYFTLNWWEYEALMYQYKLCPKDEITEYWVKHCIGIDTFKNVGNRGVLL